MKLKEIAHSRTGDKGDISNISLIPYKKEDYEMFCKFWPSFVAKLLVKFYSNSEKSNQME